MKERDQAQTTLLYLKDRTDLDSYMANFLDVVLP